MQLPVAKKAIYIYGGLEHKPISKEKRERLNEEKKLISETI